MVLLPYGFEGFVRRPRAKPFIAGDRHKFEFGDAARDWYHSPEYAEALKLKDAAMVRELYIVDGE